MPLENDNYWLERNHILWPSNLGDSDKMTLIELQGKLKSAIINLIGADAIDFSFNEPIYLDYRAEAVLGEEKDVLLPKLRVLIESYNKVIERMRPELN